MEKKKKKKEKKGCGCGRQREERSAAGWGGNGEGKMTTEQMGGEGGEERKRTVTSMDADSYRSDNALRRWEQKYECTRQESCANTETQPSARRETIPQTFLGAFLLPMHGETEAEEDGKN